MKTLAREEPKITKKLISDHGLTDGEYQKIIQLLGREPTFTELGIFSVMWSEHCSYKSSKVHLRKFPTKSEIVVQGPGENAGAIDIGDGLAAVFKIESHNHPSFIEPYQGAATGVGGILRDIFTMGARPVALLNSLRFGPLQLTKNRYLFEGVVSGIADYGNCMGVPTVGGEIYFSEYYNLNPLVNAFCIGILKKDAIFKGNASGIGNSVIYVGSKTGRDGIHGVTMASEEFDESSEAKRPNVQVGDPFTEKLLLEACLEVMKKGLIVGIQDMGGAGLTSSSSEMAGRAGTGIEIDTSLVPAREEGMMPYEIMLSESQERMLLCVKKGFENDVTKIFEKWDLDAVVIGHTIKENIVQLKYKNENYEFPVKPLTGDAPIYNRKIEKKINNNKKIDISNFSEPKDYNEALLKIISSPNLASKEWIYRQYDHMVMTNTVITPGADASVLRIKDTNKAIAVTCDCNSTYCNIDPCKGSIIAVSEAYRNLACVGARPLGITDCLNFGNPENPHIMWQFTEAIRGINTAAQFFDTPIIGGNVSFYNEGNKQNIFPTPTIGMVGLIKNFKEPISCSFKNEGDLIILLGKNNYKITASEYLYDLDLFPEIDLEQELNLSKTCIDAIENKILNSAHDCSEGGIATCLVECIVSSNLQIGAKINFKEFDRLDFWLFNENQGRVIVTILPNNLLSLEKIAKKNNIPIHILGETIGNLLVINNEVNISISNLKEAYFTGFEKAVFNKNRDS